MSGKLRLKREKFSEEEWGELKDAVLKILISCASPKKKATITYSGLTEAIKPYKIHYRCKALNDLLEEISRAEHVAGRGMLSAVVVYKYGKRIPGEGFFALAESLGKYPNRKGQDHEKDKEFWENELKTVTDYHRNEEVK